MKCAMKESLANPLAGHTAQTVDATLLCDLTRDLLDLSNDLTAVTWDLIEA